MEMIIKGDKLSKKDILEIGNFLREKFKDSPAPKNRDGLIEVKIKDGKENDWLIEAKLEGLFSSVKNLTTDGYLYKSRISKSDKMKIE